MFVDRLTTATVSRKVVGFLRNDRCGRGGGICDVGPMCAPNGVGRGGLTALEAEAVKTGAALVTSPFTTYTAEGSNNVGLKRPEVSFGKTATSSNSLMRYMVSGCSWKTGAIFLTCNA